MELSRIEQLLTKYFEGETTIQEEQELVHYFNCSKVDPSLTGYSSLFVYLSNESQTRSKQEIRLPKKKNNFLKWLSVAATITVLVGLRSYFIQNFQSRESSAELGTFDDPKVAMEETQKALSLLSANVNKGINSVQYVQNYEDARDRIFVVE